MTWGNHGGGNNNVETVAIKLINWLRKSEALRNTDVGLSMRHVYTHVSRAVVTSVRFSQSHYISRGGYFE